MGQAQNEESILVLGDSWASRTGNSLEDVCGLSDNAVETRDVRNEGRPGSTAEEWAQNEDAVRPFNREDYDYVWLSVGGNDFLESSCNSAFRAEISANIVRVIAKIVGATENENLKILFFGYSVPPLDLCGGGTTPGLYDSQTSFTRLAIETSEWADYVEVIDISDVFVTPESTPFSDDQWYDDTNVHLNDAGYEKLFSLESIQDFFGCLVPAVTSFVPTSSPTAGSPIVSNATTTESLPPSSTPVTSVPTLSSAPSFAPEPTISLSPSIAPIVDSPTTRSISQESPAALDGDDIALLVVGLFGLILLCGGVCGVFLGGRNEDEKEEKNDGVVAEKKEEEEEKKEEA